MRLRISDCTKPIGVTKLKQTGILQVEVFAEMQTVCCYNAARINHETFTN